MEKIKIDIISTPFLKEDNTFDLDKAINLAGQIAGVCYDELGFKHLKHEDQEKTTKRINRTLSSGHHSVYDHTYITFNIHKIPKMLAMVLNNEKQYTTSEKSARYTKIIKKDNSIITDKEIELYNKWLVNFKIAIREKYKDVLNEAKINKLAQENARYLVSVFMPTEMIYTTSLRQINYIASWLKDYQKNHNEDDYFEDTLSTSINDFIEELEKLNVLDERLMNNEKNRKISLFKDLDYSKEYFSDIYSTNYDGSFAQLAQAQRHRTINYKMAFLNEDKFFVPPILEDNSLFVEEWLEDIFPQGQLIKIYENGTYEDFILKCTERLCSEAQLEINNQTKKTLDKYQSKWNIVPKEIENYTKGARCTFPNYTCKNDCKFNEGKCLTRKI